VTQFDPDRLLLVLVEHEVDFVVIGGIAATIHGSRYVTDDTDILFERSRENCLRLAQALARLGAHIWSPPDAGQPTQANRRRPWQTEAIAAMHRIDPGVLGLFNIYHFVTIYGEFDCMATVPGSPPYEETRRRAGSALIGGHSVPIVDIDDLIAMKRAAGRPKDLATVDELLELRKLIEEEASRHDVEVDGPSSDE